MDMQLLEREASLALVAEYALEARRGDGRLVLIAGEAGVGKSVLVDRIRRDLPDARWSWGACDGLFTPRPLGPLFDLAEQLGGPLLESCHAGAPREELFRALLRQVGELGALDVVVIEDVHWADDATLDLLRFLGRRLRGVPALVIVTCRDDALTADDPVRVTVGDLATLPSTRRIGLAPLSVEAVRGLAEGSGFEASELYALTGGNPFYLSEVLQAGMDTVPASARDAALARAARLETVPRAVLDVAALIGARVELWLLESISGCSPSTVDELLACGLLVGDGKGLRFRHEIARLAVEQAIGPHRGEAIHSRILDALSSSGCDDDARLAFHAEAAGDGPAVLRYASAAARRSAELASHREAAAQFERALRFAAEADPSLVAELCDGLADELSLLGRSAEAAEVCERALALWNAAGDRLREGDTLRRLSHAHCDLFRGEEAVAAVKAAISVLEPLGPTVELARAYATNASQWMVYGANDEAIGLAVKAQAISERIGAPDVLSDALNTHAVCIAVKGGDWAGQMSRALDVGLSGRFRAQAARAYANFCSIYTDGHQFAEAERYFAEGLAYCERHDFGHYATFLRGEYIKVLDRTGRWDEAVKLSMELLENAGTSPANRTSALRTLGAIRARQGELDYWDHLDEAAVSADAGCQPQDIVPVRLARAEAYWLEERPDEAAREVERADDVAAGCDAWMRGAVAVWLVRTGSARSPHGEVPEPYRMELDGDPVKAAQAWNKLGCPYEEAMALAGATGEVAASEALQIFAVLGASSAELMVRRFLRPLRRPASAGPRAAAHAQPFGLTPREREVLDLLCRVHTNAEIAAKLVISAKTVDHHVSSILAKMGVPSRNAAAHQAIELGLFGTTGE